MVVQEYKISQAQQSTIKQNLFHFISLSCLLFCVFTALSEQ